MSPIAEEFAAAATTHASAVRAGTRLIDIEPFYPCHVVLTTSIGKITGSFG